MMELRIRLFDGSATNRRLVPLTARSRWPQATPGLLLSTENNLDRDRPANYCRQRQVQVNLLPRMA